MNVVATVPKTYTYCRSIGRRQIFSFVQKEKIIFQDDKIIKCIRAIWKKNDNNNQTMYSMSLQLFLSVPYTGRLVGRSVVSKVSFVRLKEYRLVGQSVDRSVVSKVSLVRLKERIYIVVMHTHILFRRKNRYFCNVLYCTVLDTKTTEKKVNSFSCDLTVPVQYSKCVIL